MTTANPSAASESAIGARGPSGAVPGRPGVRVAKLRQYRVVVTTVGNGARSSSGGRMRSSARWMPSDIGIHVEETRGPGAFAGLVGVATWLMLTMPGARMPGSRS